MTLKERMYLKNINLKTTTDNKTFGNVKLFLAKGDVHKQKTLIEDGKIILEDKEVTENLSNYSDNAVKSLDIVEI